MSNVRTIKTENEHQLFMTEVRNRQYEPKSATIEFGDSFINRLESINWDVEYVKVTRVDNHEIVDIINYEEQKKVVDKLLEEGLELAKKAAADREKILNDPNIPQQIKDAAISSGDAIIPVLNIINPDRKIRRINPETFEVEYEESDENKKDSI
jgi:hypothetical protein